MGEKEPNMATELQVIGEVIEASTTEFVAESRELHSPPPFGSFVRVAWNGDESPAAVHSDAGDPFEEDRFRRNAGKFGSAYRLAVEGDSSDPLPHAIEPAIYAVVHHATTGSVDSGRRHRAYWKDEQQLSAEQPEMEWLLLTEFRAIIIGYSSNGFIRQFLPPQPPKIHLPVHPCSNDEIRLITSKMDFLRTLTTYRNAPADEVVAACIRQAFAVRGGDFLVAAGKELANLLKDDYDRLQAIMRRAEV